MPSRSLSLLDEQFRRELIFSYTGKEDDLAYEL